MIETAIIVTVVFCGSALTGYIIRSCFASKCDKIDIGCLHIHRNTEQEDKHIKPLHIPHI